MCAWGSYWGYTDGLAQSTMDPTLGEYASEYTAEQKSAYAACYQTGYNQGVQERGTGTLVCDVVNIQTALNRLGAGLDVDGDWGTKTETALKASGKSCAELVPACKTCPRPSSTPGTTTPGAKTPGTTTTPPGTTTTPPVTPVVGTQPSAKKASALPWVLVGIAGAAVVGAGYYYISEQNAAKPNPSGRIPASLLATARRSNPNAPGVAEWFPVAMWHVEKDLLDARDENRVLSRKDSRLSASTGTRKREVRELIAQLEHVRDAVRTGNAVWAAVGDHGTTYYVW